MLLALRSAKGAKYDSQGQARSASPLVNEFKSLMSPERAEYDDGYVGLSGLDARFWLLDQGRRTRCARACPWLSYSAPLALEPLTSVRRKFERGHLVIVADEEDVAD